MESQVYNDRDKSVSYHLSTWAVSIRRDIENGFLKRKAGFQMDLNRNYGPDTI